VNPDEYLPEALRPPARGDTLSVTWTANMGPNARVGAVAEHLQNLQVALNLGERWGTSYAEQAAATAFNREVSARGPVALREAIGEWPSVIDSGLDIERILFDPRYWYGPRALNAGYGYGPEDLVRLLSSRNVPGLLGQPVTSRRIEYNNPVEVVLLGAGFLLVGGVKVLRMIRDWSSQRRIGDAMAASAEAAAQQSKSAADLGAWLVDEVRAGRQPVPVGELMRQVTPSDLEAIAKLADTDVQLQLPRQMSDE
jgi:hypothetical protein